MKKKTCVVFITLIIMMFAFPQKIYANVESGNHVAYLSGYPDGTIRPNEYVKREEAAVIFYRLLDKDIKSTPANFKDVPQNKWSYEIIGKMASKGIISGDGKGVFRPEENITRAEMSVLISRFASLKEGDYTASDIMGHWAEKEISSAVSSGWLAGYTDGEFKPNNYITRAELAFFINNALNRNPEKIEVLEGSMKTWKDNMDPNAWYYVAIQEATNTHKFETDNNNFENWKIK